MATSKSSAKDDKVFDVAKPGKTAASASSRPLIVGHKSMLKDPMMIDTSVNDMDENETVKINKPIEEDRASGSPPLPNESDENSSSEEIKAIAPSESKVKIEPLSETESSESITSNEDESEKVEEEADHKVTVKVSKSKDITSKKTTDSPDDASMETEKTETVESADDETAEKSDIEEKTTDDTESSKENSTAESTDESTDQNVEAKDSSDTSVEESSDEKEAKSDDSSPNQDDNEQISPAAKEARDKAEKEALATAAKNEQLEKQIANKQYFVPIGEKTRKKRSLRRILVGTLLILLLGIVLADLMIDVGIIKTSIQPPVKVFSSNK